MSDNDYPFAIEPGKGTVVRTPPGSGYGNWVGGKASWDPESGRFVLFYRERRPLESGRAGRCAVAVSSDGVDFTDVWTATKDEFAANSIEEGHCVRDGDRWLLYVSYEVAGTSMWRIDVLVANEPDGFETQTRRTVLQPSDYGLGWIKDPFLMRREEQWWLYAAAPARSGPTVGGKRVTAAPMDSTVVAVSDDGFYFPEIEYVFEAPGDDSWHGRRARINSIVEWKGELLAFYDGGRTFYDNYEEKAGIAMSADGRSFRRVGTDRPWCAEGVRYVSAVVVDEGLRLYYEFTRPDGSHDLRTTLVPD